MITLTRLSGSAFVLNCDLIERIDSTPDTIVSLIDGKKYVVAESLEEVVRAVRQHRSEVIALSANLQPEPLAGDLDVPATHLAPVTVFPSRRAAAAHPEQPLETYPAERATAEEV